MTKTIPRGPATRQRRADIRALCRALVLWRLRCVPRPLSPSSPAEVEDEAWDAETDRLHDEFLAEFRSVSEPVQHLLVAAQGSAKLRGIARDELNKLGETKPYLLHGLKTDGLTVLV